MGRGSNFDGLGTGKAVTVIMGLVGLEDWRLNIGLGRNGLTRGSGGTGGIKGLCDLGTLGLGGPGNLGRSAPGRVGGVGAL